ncbi:MAG: hypothetical protein UT30_C0033G0017 [Candidatus Uhrbacteria bacterium GW2011_GWF2_39_13]|uniref:Uncharacterized protein n=1 Tax=Candidatus Uhrbacteria bacterium GW2011_GWF2_39_13 TaxID=1618995 RepID=A0A0G0MS89_9BACT|nr:MAG: hypothetical protein UT30_C0033G0017 [Candidatus Uhrbacteria bacterium GW2011_GWF2_39_13]
MNSKERVFCAIGHEEADRVPIGEWGFGKELVWPVLGEKSLYPRTLEQIKAYWEGKRNQVIDDWKKGLVSLVTKLNWDTVLVHLNIGKNTPIDIPEQIDVDKWRDRQGNILLYTHELDRICIVEKGPPDYALNNVEKKQISSAPNVTKIRFHFKRPFCVRDNFFLVSSFSGNAVRCV